MNPRKKNGKFTTGLYALKVKRASAGLGLFALEAIPKGACVVEYVGRVLSREEEYTSRSRYLFHVSEKKTIDGAPRWNLARYINHSCRPNCEIEYWRSRVFVMARRNVKPGEELSYDYGKEYFDQFIAPKGCRCRKCHPAA